MRNSFAFAAFMVLSFAVMPTVAPAQTFEKKNFNYSDWTKGRFSEAVTVIGPGKMIFLAGVGSEDENGKGGDISTRATLRRSASTLSTRSSVRWRRTAPHLAISRRWSLI
jgi:hypothetical protein